MNIILLTILLTLLGTGLVVLLVWLSTASWKSIKFREKAKTKFKELNKNLEETTNNIYRDMEERTTIVNNSINELHTFRDQDLLTNNKNLKELYDNLSRIIENTDSYNLSRFKEFERSIDSRFDKSNNLRNQDIQNEDNNLQNLRNYTVERFKELEHTINSRFDKK